MNAILHKSISDNFTEILQEIEILRKENKNLKEIKQDLLNKHEKIENKYLELKNIFREVKKEKNLLSKNCTKLKLQNQRLINELQNNYSSGKIDKQHEEIVKLQKEKVVLNKIINKKNIKINRLVEKLKLIKRKNEELEAGQFEKENFCENATCENFSLCNSKVLIVGGIEKMKANYREIVQEFEGSFRYHGGHQKGCCNKLDKLINWADYVICPTDINSHYACLQVKNICKKMDKEYFMLRSSGISTVYKQVKEIARLAS